MGDRSDVENHQGGAASCSLCFDVGAPLMKCAGNGGVEGGSCGVHVHKACLVKCNRKIGDRSELPEKWICQPCEDGNDSAQLECHDCTCRPAGALFCKKSRSGPYVHTLCRFHGYYNPLLKNKDIHGNLTVCDFCKEAMYANTRCSHGKCDVQVHPMCAFIKGYGDITDLKCRKHGGTPRARGNQAERRDASPLEPIRNSQAQRPARTCKNTTMRYGPFDEDDEDSSGSYSDSSSISPASWAPSSRGSSWGSEDASPSPALISPSYVEPATPKRFRAFPAVASPALLDPQAKSARVAQALVTPSPAVVQGEDSPHSLGSSAKRRRREIVDETDESGDEMDENAKRARVDNDAVASSAAVVVPDAEASDEIHPEVANGPSLPPKSVKKSQTKKRGSATPSARKPSASQSQRATKAQLLESNEQLKAQTKQQADELAAVKASRDQQAEEREKAFQEREKALEERETAAIASRDSFAAEARAHEECAAKLEASHAREAKAKEELEASKASEAKAKEEIESRDAIIAALSSEPYRQHAKAAFDLHVATLKAGMSPGVRAEFDEQRRMREQVEHNAMRAQNAPQQPIPIQANAMAGRGGVPGMQARGPQNVHHAANQGRPAQIAPRGAQYHVTGMNVNPGAAAHVGQPGQMVARQFAPQPLDGVTADPAVALVNHWRQRGWTDEQVRQELQRVMAQVARNQRR